MTSVQNHYQFQYEFHPAGQGIFASGCVVHDTLQNIPAEPVQGNAFRWVFDCGSTSPTGVLLPSVVSYRRELPEAYLDLLCISHFDFDHVSGLEELLRGLAVGTVVIPYYSSLERLILGALYEGDSDSYRNFLSNPVAWLLETATSIERIIIVGNHGPDEGGPQLPDRLPDPTTPVLPADPEPKRERERFWTLRIPAGTDTPELELQQYISPETCQFAQEKNTSVMVLPRPFSAEAGNYMSLVWEFLFFHKPLKPRFAEALRKRLVKVTWSGGIEGLVEVVQQRLTDNPPPNISLMRALSSPSIRRRIRKAYADLLGGETKLNSASLCVYAGPIPPLTGHVDPPRSWPPTVASNNESYDPSPLNRISILYTGDADFTRASDRSALRGFLEMRRWHEVAVLQVPHHGSRYNWEAGSAAEFSHRWSIFCADPGYKHRHPHQEVLVDLIHYNPRLVDKATSWTWNGHFA